MYDNFDNEAKLRALKALSGDDSVLAKLVQDEEALRQLAQPQITPVESALRGGAQGATLGWGDELSAALGAAMPTEADAKSYPERFSAIKQALRKENEEARAANPNWYTGGEIGGGLITAGATPGLTGAKLLTNIPAAAATLAGYGGIYGAGAAEGAEPSPEEKEAVEKLRKEGSVMAEEFPTSTETTLKGAYEGGKAALTAPYDLAKATAEKLGAGELGGAAGTSGLMALSILPFALKGAPINKFIVERARKDANKLAQTAINALDKGDMPTARNTLITLRNHSVDAKAARDMFEKGTSDWLMADKVRADAREALNLVAEQFEGAQAQALEKTRQTVAGARQAAEEMRPPKTNVVNLKPTQQRSIQVTDESGQMHTISPRDYSQPTSLAEKEAYLKEVLPPGALDDLSPAAGVSKEQLYDELISTINKDENVQLKEAIDAVQARLKEHGLTATNKQALNIWNDFRDYIKENVDAPEAQGKSIPTAVSSYVDSDKIWRDLAAKRGVRTNPKVVPSEVFQSKLAALKNIKQAQKNKVSAFRLKQLREKFHRSPDQMTTEELQELSKLSANDYKLKDYE